MDVDWWGTPREGVPKAKEREGSRKWEKDRKAMKDEKKKKAVGKERSVHSDSGADFTNWS